MKFSEKQRLIALTRDAVQKINTGNPQIKARAVKASVKFSPTSAETYRELSEIVWWLIAADAHEDVMNLLDALCEVDDEYYWMFHALASSFATRAWLHSQQKNAAGARHDAQMALQWICRDPNAKAISAPEITEALKLFDDWIVRADRETGTVTALHVLAHAMRVLVMYQQIAKAGDPAAKSVAPREFSSRLNSGIKQLRHRIEAW
jgi:hypothetical protein